MDINLVEMKPTTLCSCGEAVGKWINIFLHRFVGTVRRQKRLLAHHCMMYQMKWRMEDIVGIKISIILLASIVFIMLVGCSGTSVVPTPVQESQPTRAVAPVASGDLRIVTGQRLYVPAYSSVYDASEDRTFEMAVTLSIRNTNLDKPILINSVQYFDTNGQLVTDYVESPLQLAPMATTDYVIAQADTQGGTGASFIVVWGAEEPVYEPVVEAIMISTSGTQGLSFLSPARVLEEK